MGVRVNVSPSPCEPCAANQGAPHAPGPPNPTPWIPSALTMSFTPSFCDVRSIDKRETANDAVLTLLVAKMWFQEITACCDRLSKFAPNPGRFSVVAVIPLLGENPFSVPILYLPKRVSPFEKS